MKVCDVRSMTDAEMESYPLFVWAKIRLKIEKVRKLRTLQ